MMYSALLLGAMAAVASSQVTYNSTTGKFTCPANAPNGAFCAGDSLTTNIILRCSDGVAQPGNCNDNLAGYPPIGVQGATCWQSSPTSGIAACAKNCIVQGSSGTYNGTFTLPNCTPVGAASSSIPAPSSNITTTAPPSNTTVPTPAPTTTITETVTTTTVCTSNGVVTTSTITYTTTYCPPNTLITSATHAAGNSTLVPVVTSGKQTATAPATTVATATPVGPTASKSASATPSTVVISGAGVNSGSAVAGLAAIGLFVAYLL